MRGVPVEVPVAGTTGGPAQRGRAVPHVAGCFHRRLLARVTRGRDDGVLGRTVRQSGPPRGGAGATRGCAGAARTRRCRFQIQTAQL
jgi:hypothetical protein